MTSNIESKVPRYGSQHRTSLSYAPVHSPMRHATWTCSVAPVQNTPRGLGDNGRLGEGEVLEVDGVLRGAGVRPVYEIAFNETHGSGHVSTGDTLYGRVEVIEGLALDNLSADLAANTERREATLDDDDAVIERQKM